VDAALPFSEDSAQSMASPLEKSRLSTFGQLSQRRTCTISMQSSWLPAHTICSASYSEIVFIFFSCRYRKNSSGNAGDFISPTEKIFFGTVFALQIKDRESGTRNLL